MGSRNISVPDDVYEKLREERGADESFGDVIDRLLARRDLEEFWGAWSDETAERSRDAVELGRDRSDDRLERLLE